jgi:hypothetical protein
MADAPVGDIRSTILSELAAGPTGDAPAQAEKPVEAAPVEETADADPVEADEADLETSADEDDTPVEDDPSDDDELELKSDDPKEQKLLDNVRRAEKRMREAAARRDSEFQAESQKWQQQVDRVAEIDRLLSRAKHDPIALLRAAGVSDDDFELIAQAVYAESPALQKDPKQKAAAQAKLRERDKEEKLSTYEKKLAEIEAKLEQQTRDAQVAQEAQAYISQINAAASSKHPLVAKLLKADPDETTDALVKTYNALGKKLNRAPKATEVVAAYDKAERSRLTKLGIDPDTIGKRPALGAKPVVKAPNGNTPSTPAPKNGAKKMTPQEERAAILAELAAQ